MKKCPFCAEDIQEAAIKCKHCGEFLEGAVRPPPVLPPPAGVGSGLPWYYRTTFIILALASVGPFALPLVWFRPRTKPGWKVGVSLAVLVLTFLLVRMSVWSIRMLQTFYKMLAV